jgi:hypothetical protein
VLKDPDGAWEWALNGDAVGMGLCVCAPFFFRLLAEDSALLERECARKEREKDDCRKR